MSAVVKLKAVENREYRIKCQCEYTKFKGDSNNDILNAFTTWLKYESSSLIDDLPHIAAVIEFWELVTVKYDYSNSAEMVSGILNGTDSDEAYNQFLDKYKLTKKGWARQMVQ